MNLKEKERSFIFDQRIIFLTEDIMFTTGILCGVIAVSLYLFGYYQGESKGYRKAMNDLDSFLKDYQKKFPKSVDPGTNN
jgi:hypothetical protein